jgi:ABC-type transport system involved in cytochrome bd biosynthesis fused ATPase/permease subunit
VSGHMDERLAFYQRCRVAHQRAWYQGRCQEFEQARRQLVHLTGALLITAAAFSGMAAFNAAGQGQLWAVLAAVLPAFSTGLGAFGSLYAFERHAKLYGDAVNALRKATAEAPEAGEMDDEALTRALHAYVEQVEDIFRREQGQWGQLAADVPSAGNGAKA